MRTRHTIIGVTLAALGITALSQVTMRSVWEGVYTSDQAKHGQTLYSSYCATCHGDELEGTEGSPQLIGAEFTSKWEGRTADTLLDRIHKTMPADHPGKLNPEEDVSVLAYILEQNGIPAGKTAMSHESEALKQIQLIFQKHSE
jgi:mono/diheme cytochrome c family protein